MPPTDADGRGRAAEEASVIRASVGNKMILVTPGIRQEGSTAADQKRTTTPAAAIAAGADYLVVGRPVTQQIRARQRRRSLRKLPAL